ncbi:Zinc finger FYVE domain-containing protein 9-like [Homarus americanus]|uniref:Zinc finger FYVE domain-containing protein 9-like n=1 Tax=Homarus americanus TaxID=6706 RepID=A0A8J5N2Q1_HOMAM|nr:Zinc finger FYVE domain-containing protein 9-like [Homarus americanus]
MEKFAVDLDKVLDDFELDEDESESVNQYEKLQLEFCPDGGGTLPPVRHGVGLGTFGGWSEPLQPQAIGAASQPWCGVGLDREAQPPGTRSPPDGQNDDSEPPAACSQPPPSLPYLPGAQLPPPQVSQLHSGDVLDSGVRPGNMLMNQHSATSQALWPVIATSAAGSFSQAPMPSVQAESYAAERFGLPVSGGSAGTGNVSSRVPAMPPDYHIPGVPESSSATSESEGNAVVGVSSKNIPREGFDVIASRPLDVVPASVPPDRGLAGGHETRHPDIIDVWQSGAEASASASQPSDRVRPEVVDHEQSNGESQEVDNEGASGSANCVEQQEHRLLPDLMAMNSVDNLAVSEGTYSGPEYYEPAIVMENALSNLRLNEPAIVMESQSCSRIPEVVNVHQTAEQQGHTDTPSSVAGGTLCNTPATGDMSHASLDGVSHGIDDAPGILQDHINQVCDNVARLDEIHSVDAVRVDPQPPTQSSLPDVSAVGTVPISFSKNSDIDDADLDAELAELEEEQFRLQGAYGGSVARSLTSSQEDSTGEITHPEVQSTCEANLSGGPDLIGGTSTSQPILGVDLGGSEAAQTTGASAATEENPKPEVPAWQRYGSDAEERQSSLVGNPDIAAQENISFSNHPGTEGVEEVICHPHRSQRGEATENYRERDTGDNLSSNSTGTDTMSSSSTLTDGDLGSPERRLQQPVAEPESPSRVTPGALVTAVYDDDSGSGREDDGSGGALAAGEAAASSNPGNPSEGNGSLVGHVAPFWIPDEDAPNCQECGLKFTVIRRRHHCRACGRVLCAQCCHHKAPLPYMDYKEARVCGPCLQILQSGQEDGHDGDMRQGRQQPDGQRRPPDPNNPMEYCSRVPPPQQVAASATVPPPTVMVPVGVLKREGSSSSARSRGNKQVIFSDGIRPGGDLTELDGSGELLPPYRRSGRVARRVDRPTTGGGVGGGVGGLLRSLPPDRCLIPPGAGLPPVVVQAPATGEYVFEDNPDSSKLEQQMKVECCVGVEVWNIATRGLCTVGQEEMVVLLEVAPGETHPPRDIFAFFHTVYQQANQGNLVSELGHTIFTEPEGFLGSREHGGFLYIRPTFQCLRNLVLPPSPYIFAVLIQKWETPWAKVFPLRLMLRMGAEFRYYPCPLVSARNRKPVFCEIGHTIMNLLVDFRNYAYTVPGIEGFVIHMEDKKTSLLFPKNRYEQVTKALSNSNDHVLALGANFSPQADSHLVTIENDDGHYSTQAINIHNRPRRVTGASFIVFNGALKTTSGLSAKSSIVEDGLMVQIPADMMTKLREALQNMKDFEIPCGPVSASQPDEVVTIKWTSDDKNFNIGIKSPVDEKQMDGIPSVKIHSGTDYVSNAHLIRWTEVFIMQGESNNSNDVNLSRLSELLARSFCVALTPHLSDLYSNGHTCLGLRTTIHQDSVGYEAGSSGSRLPASCMNDLDVELIPVIHRAAANITDQPIILELVFHIMEQ